MYLHAIATAVPPVSYTQADCWEIALRSPVRHRLQKRSMLILQAVLRSEHGIAKRHFAMPDPESVYDLSPDQLNEGFRAEAPRLAGRALTVALEKAGVRAADVDALLICTCTGYLCPGVTSYVAEQLGLRSNAFLQDLVGLGCGAAIPMLRAASHILAAQPNAVVACVAVEICSAAFYVDDDPGVLVSACLFGDGAAATVWRSTPAAGNGMAMAFQSAELALTPLLAYARGDASWAETCRAVHAALHERFRVRLASAQALHPFLLQPRHQRWFAALGRAGLLPFRPLYAALH